MYDTPHIRHLNAKPVPPREAEAGGSQVQVPLGQLSKTPSQNFKKGLGTLGSVPSTTHTHTHTHTDYSMSYSKYKNEFNAKHGKKDGRAESNIH